MKIVAILACSSRAGVDFFQSLLDNHPEISQFPGALNFDEFIKEIEPIKDPEVIAELFIKKFEKFFDSRKNLLERHNYLGKDKNEYFIVDKTKFKNNFLEIKKKYHDDLKGLLISLNLAYSAAAGENIDKKKIIILHLHHFFRFKFMKGLDFDVVCTVRDPLSSYSSFMKNLAYLDSKTIHPWKFYFHIERSFYHLKWITELNKRTFVIKLEDLHIKNLTVMKNFCNKFSISFEESMQQSTYHGLQWWGDRLSRKDLGGININFQNSFDKKFFFEKDISFIEHQLKNFYEKYKYPFRSKKTNQRLLNYLPLKVDYIILKESIFSFNVKNVFLCIYYFLKRLKNYISIKDKNNFPENL